ncbi:stringent starvation protein A [Candidatus Berkiella cookevillensis]|uniref:Stringent starvation protein A n=1 Tax=Candidatus Berkiella cookevillensis TaxID=437022 RepID=A0AAE3HSV2_9GAMM|nr:stringent starvation protein A [Candidatus Berkiella cookevillensis]
MAVLANKRSVMTLYSGSNDPYSHRARIVLAEKGVTFDLYEIDPAMQPNALSEINPYNSVPTLVDRDLVLYESEIIMEYLDERFPHPPLMPVYPVARARSRLMLHRVNRDWYVYMRKILNKSTDPMDADDARKALKESITSVAPVFNEMPFFFSEEFSLVDCAVAPLLWRLPSMGIELGPEAKPVYDYAKRIFKREPFQVSLTDTERALREL